MYTHRTYREQSNDFEQMVSLISYLNGLHRCDWSLGRLHAWKYGRWSRESQMDCLFEKQAGLFFDGSGKLCGIVITEDFGNSYSLLSIKDPDVIQFMLDFLLQAPSFEKPCRIVVPEKDLQQTEILERNGFVFAGDADVTYTYGAGDLALRPAALPNGYTMTSQQEYKDKEKAERLRFFAFNPESVFDDVMDYAYRYARKNPILVPELSILLLNESGEPVSTCMGYWDRENRLMEVEVVATKKEYENRGFARAVISECIRRGMQKGVQEFSISAWEEKTRKLYSSFGKARVSRKICMEKKEP